MCTYPRFTNKQKISFQCRHRSVEICVTDDWLHPPVLLLDGQLQIVPKFVVTLLWEPGCRCSIKLQCTFPAQKCTIDNHTGNGPAQWLSALLDQPCVILLHSGIICCVKRLSLIWHSDGLEQWTGIPQCIAQLSPSQDAGVANTLVIPIANPSLVL